MFLFNTSLVTHEKRLNDFHSDFRNLRLSGGFKDVPLIYGWDKPLNWPYFIRTFNLPLECYPIVPNIEMSSEEESDEESELV